MMPCSMILQSLPFCCRSFGYPRSPPLVTANRRHEVKKKMAKASKQTSSPDFDRVKFDDSKIGVKGLLDANAGVIPGFFVHPPEHLFDLNSASDKDIPVIDLTGVESNRRLEIVEQIRHASSSWGFFQVINHGIPITVMDDTINAIKSFNEQPTPVKAEFYTRDPASPFSFSSNVDLFRSKAASWRDSIQVRLGLNPAHPEQIPAICRKEILEWDERAKGLAEKLSELLGEGLGMEPGRLKELSCFEARLLAGHYYPYCPQAELTMGLTTHADPGVLTVVLQDQIGGLQVKNNNEWVPAKPLPGALVINIGDILQILSNDEYKSVKHRVVANSFRDARVSIAVFFNPSKRGDSNIYGPLPELLSPEKTPRYRNFTMNEFMEAYFNKGLDAKSHIDHLRL